MHYSSTEDLQSLRDRALVRVVSVYPRSMCIPWKNNGQNNGEDTVITIKFNVHTNETSFCLKTCICENRQTINSVIFQLQQVLCSNATLLQFWGALFLENILSVETSLKKSWNVDNTTMPRKQLCDVERVFASWKYDWDDAAILYINLDCYQIW